MEAAYQPFWTDAMLDPVPQANMMGAPQAPETVYATFLDPSLSSEMDDRALRRDQHHETFVYEPLGHQGIHVPQCFSAVFY